MMIRIVKAAAALSSVFNAVSAGIDCAHKAGFLPRKGNVDSVEIPSAADIHFLLSRIPLFNGRQFETWSNMMKTMLISQDLWYLVEGGYTTEELSVEELVYVQKKDATALLFIQQAIDESVFSCIAKASNSNQAWDALQKKYHGIADGPCSEKHDSMVSKGDYCDASEQGHQANAQERTSSVCSAFGSKSKHSGYNIGGDYGDFRSNNFVSKKCYKRNSYSRGGICRNNKSVNDNWRCHKSQDNGRFIKNQGCHSSSMFGDYKSKNPKLELASSWTRDVNKSKEALEELQHKQQNNIKVESQVGKSCGGLDQFRTSLYVNDLHVDVTDSQLYGIFSHFGQVVSASVCTDFTSHKSLCFGHVSYSNSKDASRALEVLNFTPFNGKPIHIVYPHQDPPILKSGAKGLFIMNLDKSIDDMVLQTIFSSFGNIVICKVATNASGLSKGYGQIEYDSEQAMQKAIENMNGAVLNRKEVFLRPF